jgi:hypothetical protein
MKTPLWWFSEQALQTVPPSEAGEPYLIDDGIRLTKSSLHLLRHDGQG